MGNFTKVVTAVMYTAAGMLITITEVSGEWVMYHAAAAALSASVGTYLLFCKVQATPTKGARGDMADRVDLGK